MKASLLNAFLEATFFVMSWSIPGNEIDSIDYDHEQRQPFADQRKCNLVLAGNHWFQKLGQQVGNLLIVVVIDNPAMKLIRSITITITTTTTASLTNENAPCG
jgi:hypothetical protein